MTYRSIDAYLDDLAWRLHVGARARRRILREVGAHLADLVAEEEAAGLTPQAAARRATSRFGEPVELAVEFNRDSALHGLRSAAWALAVCVAGSFVAAGAALHGWAPETPWPNVPVYYGVTELLLQVAAVSAGVGFLLAVAAPRLLGRDPDGRVLTIAGRALAVASATLVPVAVVSAGNIGGAAWGEAAMSAFVALAVPVAGFFGARAMMRAALVHRTEDGGSTLDVLADCCDALAERYAIAATVYRLANECWTSVAHRAPALVHWLELRRHPWRAGVTVSVAAGVALKAPDLLKGDVDLPVAVIEAAAVFVSYVLLGGLLGLRPTRAEPLDPVGVEG